MNDLLKTLKLSLLHVGYAELDSNWNFKDVISSFTRLFYVTKGNATMNHTNQVFNLKAGYMYLVPSNVYNSYTCALYHEQYYVGFFEEIQPGLSINNIKRFKYEVEATPIDLQYFKKLIDLNPNLEVTDSTPKVNMKKGFTEKGKKNEQINSSNQFLETQGILSILLSRFVEDGNVMSLGNNDERDLNKILIHISKNLHKKLSVNGLAEYCDLSPDHFSRSFIKKYGIKPIKYIQFKRIERSQFLLISTRDSLINIAEQVGFENLSYFSRTFKKLTGKTPASFRKEHLNA